jgi:hypothetical protein
MDPGTAISIVSLSFQLFAGCIKGFNILSSAHNLGKHAVAIRCRLNLEESKLIEWAKQAGLLKENKRLDPRLNEKLVEEVLAQLEQLLLDTNKLKQRYGIDLVDPTMSTPAPPAPPTPASSTVAPCRSSTGHVTTLEVLRGIISGNQRQKIIADAESIQSKAPFFKQLRWGIMDEKKMRALLDDIGLYVQQLSDLLDKSKQEEMRHNIELLISTSIALEKRFEGLEGVHLALGGSPQFSTLEVSALLKMLRIELKEEGTDSERSVDPQTKSVPTNALPAQLQLATGPSRRTFLTKPLSSRLLTNTVLKDPGSTMGIARYDGQVVFLEYHDLNPSLRDKLKSRAQNLAALLHAPKDKSFRTLHCIGLVEDNQHRYIFVYQHPTASGQPRSLLDLLRDSKFLPSVTQRCQLAFELANTVHHIHTAGWLHKSLRSENILYFQSVTAPMTLFPPYVAGFAYSRYDSPSEISQQPSTSPERDIYRHPSAQGEPSLCFNKLMDIYSLGTILVELAEWRSLKRVVSKKLVINEQTSTAETSRVRDYLLEEYDGEGIERNLAFRMGEVYSKVTMSCLKGDFLNGQELTEDTAALLHQNFFNKVVKELHGIVT